MRIKKSRKNIIKSARRKKAEKIFKIIILVVLVIVLSILSSYLIKILIEKRNSINETEIVDIVENNEYLETEEQTEEALNEEDLLKQLEIQKMQIISANHGRYNFSELDTELNKLVKLYENGNWVSIETDTKISEELTEENLEEQTEKQTEEHKKLENTSKENAEQSETNVETNVETDDEVESFDIAKTEQDLKERINLEKNNKYALATVGSHNVDELWAEWLPKNGCLIIIARLKPNSEFTTNIRDYIKSLELANSLNTMGYVYTEPIETGYNGYMIVCACDNAEEVSSLIINYMADKDNEALKEKGLQ